MTSSSLGHTFAANPFRFRFYAQGARRQCPARNLRMREVNSNVVYTIYREVALAKCSLCTAYAPVHLIYWKINLRVERDGRAYKTAPYSQYTRLMMCWRGSRSTYDMTLVIYASSTSHSHLRPHHYVGIYIYIQT